MSGRPRPGGRGTGGPQSRVGGGGPRPSGGRGGFYGPPGGSSPQPRMSGGQRGTPQGQRMQPYPVAKPTGRPSGQGQVPQPRLSGSPAQGKGQGANNPQKPATKPVALDHSYSLKVRRLVEHRLRNPHRRFPFPTLVRCNAHWAVSVPVGTIPLLSQAMEIEKKLTAEHAVPMKEQPVSEESDVVNARALICPGIKSQDPAHILKRISVIAKKLGTTPAEHSLEAYGGLVPNSTDDEVVSALAQLVEAQCGLDLKEVTWYKFFELQYAKDEPPTVFFLPAVWELSTDPVVCSLAKEETIERVELIEQEISREGMTDDEFQEAKAALEPEKKTITEVKRTIIASPVSVTILESIADNSSSGKKDAHELHTAIDALDEFLRREMATQILGTLKNKNNLAKEAAEKKAIADKEKAELKRKRDEAMAEKREAKQAKLDALHAMWEQEDQGKTDDEKLEAQAERKVQEQKIMTEGDEPEAEDGQAAAASDEPPKKYRTIIDINQSILDSFEYFDRPQGTASKGQGFIPRGRIENILLCTDDDMCLTEVDELVNCAGRSAQIAYKMLATVERKEEIVPEPAPEPAAEEPKAEAAADEEMKAEAAEE